MRVEIMLDKNQKISQSVMGAFHEEVSKRVCALFPETIVQIRQGSYTKIEMLGASLDEDKRRLNDLLQNVFEDGSWLH
ncbi:DinI-like family protein [Pantoea rwandensis]|uniref:Damage-inducible protein DinI n=1 Tax=Pantoea rwandensis TaxID=1076550 RepID=A0ABM5RFY5_9GAMM|nr:DinI-like family protein [Pantoea rwandensis]AIR84876.1 damage-inducible protein DinI [Pantoea rwandensis]